MKPGSIRFWRRLVQLCVALAFILIPILNKAEFNLFSGNFLAFSAAGVPFNDPLAALQVVLGTAQDPAPFLGTDNNAMFLGAGLVLLVALLLGPVFCSWICPYGFLSELTHGLQAGKKAQAAPQAARLEPAGAAGPSPRPIAARAGIALLGLGLVLFISPVPLLNQLSMPGWYSRGLQHLVLYGDLLVGAGIMLLLFLLLEGVIGKRIWCRYICPQSVLISLAAWLMPARLRVRFTRKSCTCPASDRACLAACSLGLNPRAPKSAAQRLQCTNCGDCIDACRARGGALDFA
ncbi:4Fe-4S binding protein, partial [Desulfovibrio sp. OttesenSCG-928-A18]|nr:4Fe-4S binding protein [Desulfovibrio sp. OttesenSCG-928-A18]